GGDHLALAARSRACQAALAGAMDLTAGRARYRQVCATLITDAPPPWTPLASGDRTGPPTAGQRDPERGATDDGIHRPAGRDIGRRGDRNLRLHVPAA